MRDNFPVPIRENYEYYEEPPRLGILSGIPRGDRPMTDLSLLSTFIVFLGGILAGFIDSIAGGGGMVTLPILLSVGLPPHLALGTNKLQSPFGSLTSTIKYARSGLFKWKEIWPGIIFTFLGAMTGTILIQRLSATFLEKAVPILLGLIFLYTLIKKNLGSKRKKQKISSWMFFITFGLILGFYDGFFGPGTGSFWTIAFVTVLGMDLRGATGATKPMNLTSNLTALVFFILGGNVVFSLGLIMAAGQVIGSLGGSHLVIKKPPRFIRAALLIIVGLTIVNTFRQYYF